MRVSNEEVQRSLYLFMVESDETYFLLSSLFSSFPQYNSNEIRRALDTLIANNVIYRTTPGLNRYALT